MDITQKSIRRFGPDFLMLMIREMLSPEKSSRFRSLIFLIMV